MNFIWSGVIVALGGNVIVIAVPVTSWARLPPLWNPLSVDILKRHFFSTGPGDICYLDIICTSRYEVPNSRDIIIYKIPVDIDIDN